MKIIYNNPIYSYLKVFFTQGLTSQIRIFVKFNVMSKTCFKHKKYLWNKILNEITSDILIKLYNKSQKSFTDSKTEKIRT